jgi:hypothetical protein
VRGNKEERERKKREGRKKGLQEEKQQGYGLKTHRSKFYFSHKCTLRDIRTLSLSHTHAHRYCTYTTVTAPSHLSGFNVVFHGESLVT